MDYHVVNIVSFVKELIHAKPVWSYINLNLIFSVISYLCFQVQLWWSSTLFYWLCITSLLLQQAADCGTDQVPLFLKPGGLKFNTTPC